jgi:malate synthase
MRRRWRHGGTNSDQERCRSQRGCAGKGAPGQDREVTDGCDGTWVAHPALVPIAKAVFDQYMPTPNQYSKQRADVNYTAKDLLNFQPEQPITEAGLRNNINVGIQYLGAWLAGKAACRFST